MGHNNLPALESLSSEESLKALIESTKNEPDLVLVLLVGNYLDGILEATLSKRLSPGNTAKRLLSHIGPLGTFQARIDLCYCLSLISKEAKKNLDAIGLIRNRFAHSHRLLTFDDVEIAAHCERLSWYKNEKGEAGDFPLKPESHRQRFGLAFVSLLIHFFPEDEQSPKSEGSLDSRRYP
jgi:hypothetical protein